MKKPFEFVCDIAPGCCYKLGVLIYSDAKQLQKAAGGDSFIDGEVEAFCVRENGENDRIATLHFYKNSMPPGTVAHEVFHAVLELIKVLRLNMDDGHAQEVAAHAVTHLVEQVSKARKNANHSRH